MRFYRKRKDLEMNEKRMARELGRYWRALIEEHYLILCGKPCSKAAQATRELSLAAKLALWGVACRLLTENRSYVDKAWEPETDPSEDIGSYAA